MKLTAAVVREQGQSFVVIRVGDHVLHHPTLRSELLGYGRQEFRRPVALMGQRDRQTYGPPEIVNRLRRIPVEDLAWQEFDLR